MPSPRTSVRRRRLSRPSKNSTLNRSFLAAFQAARAVAGPSLSLRRSLFPLKDVEDGFVVDAEAGTKRGTSLEELVALLAVEFVNLVQDYVKVVLCTVHGYGSSAQKVNVNGSTYLAAILVQAPRTHTPSWLSSAFTLLEYTTRAAPVAARSTSSCCPAACAS